MMDLPKMVGALVSFVLLGTAGIVAIKLLNGHIETTGLLRTRNGEAVDPERVALMIATVAGGFAYFSYGLSHGLDEGGLPALPSELVTAMSGGNFLFLAGKAFRMRKV